MAYTTLKTIIDRLEKKGAIKRVRQYGRTILYTSVKKKEELSTPLLKRLLNNVFAGNRKALFANLVRDEKLTSDEIQFLEELLEEGKKTLEAKE